jgi:uncharacterized glyoxalase superfamily protein PhnB
MAALFGYLSYDDAPAAIAWLEALGFTATTRQDGDDGTVTHCELKLGDAVVMVSSFDDDYELPPLRGHSTGAGLYLRVENVTELYEAAIGAGATSVFGPERTEWGTERARVLDPEGREWSFGTYEPGGSW